MRTPAYSVYVGNRVQSPIEFQWRESELDTVTGYAYMLVLELERYEHGRCLAMVSYPNYFYVRDKVFLCEISGHWDFVIKVHGVEPDDVNYDVPRQALEQVLHEGIEHTFEVIKAEFEAKGLSWSRWTHPPENVLNAAIDEALTTIDFTKH